MNKRFPNVSNTTDNTQIINVGSAVDALTDTSTLTTNRHYTIENHLYKMSQDPRFSYLWSNWCVEKIEYIRQLEAAQHNTYSDYSLHDKNHSDKIIINIERMLGPKRIAALTPGDAWLILQCAYAHDLGMNVTDSEKRLLLLSPKSDEIIKSREFKDEFKRAIKKMRSSNDEDHHSLAYSYYTLRRAADYWNDHIEELFDDNPVFRETVFGKDFSMASFFYHIIVQSHFRSIHADRSRQILEKQHLENVIRDVIPRHMRVALSEIVSCHVGKPDVVVKNLEYKQNGFDSGDYIHPRFVAALLRLGDLLDAESTRFNPFTIDNLENISEDNLAYIIKDLSVSEILIDPMVINVTASFKTKMVEVFLINQGFCKVEEDTSLRIRQLIASSVKYMRSWMRYIESNTAEFWCLWKDIAPESMTGCLPAPHKLKILYDGQEVDENDLDLRYRIEPIRAAEIIEGAGLYEESLVFLREIIQNAIDATTLEVYRKILKNNNKNDITITLPEFFKKYAYAYKERSVHVDIKHDKEKHKLTVAVVDKGIGISRVKLNNMRQVGAVKELAWEKEIEKMPDWMKPTADFGIGMQSVFLVVDKFTLHSRPNNSENNEKPLQHRIVFNSMKYGGDITSIEKEIQIPDLLADNTNDPWDEKAGTNYPYGTRFSIDIALDEINAFTKRFGIGSVGADNLPMFVQNLFPIVKRKFIKFLQEQFIHALVPIETRIDGKLEDTCSFDLMPITDAISHCSLNEIMVFTRNGEPNLYFWHTHKWGKKFQNEFNAMYIYKPAATSIAKTRLFYRGIRFGFSGGSHKSFHLDNLASDLGFDCDINIMSGCAHDFLEINREEIKEEKYTWFCQSISRGLENFYDKVIILIGKLSKKDEDLCASDIDLKRNLQILLRSSALFISQLQIYATVKNINSNETRSFLSHIAGGMRSIALFDKREGKIVFTLEPVANAGDILSEMLIDIHESASGSKIDLSKNDPRLRQNGNNDNCATEKLLCNVAPTLLNLRFSKLRAYPCLAKDCREIVKIYNLTAVPDTQQTEMDMYSYQVIVKNIVENYKVCLDAGEIDANYLPVLPAPPVMEGISRDIGLITFAHMPKSGGDYDEYCDNRFARFIISPYTVAKLVDCLKGEGTENLNFNELMNDVCDSCKCIANNDMCEQCKLNINYRNLCSPSVAYMRKVCNTKGELAHESTNISHRIFEIWGEFAAVIKQMLEQ